MTLDELQAHLDRLDDGILKGGSHSPGREFCALEFESQVRKRKWSDAPITLPDLRALNDGPWSSDQARTQALLPVMVALWDWVEWTPEKRRQWASRMAILTVQRIVAELPGLSEDRRAACRAAVTLADARRVAAEVAAEAAARAAADAAAAADVAAAAADAAAAAAAAADVAAAAADVAADVAARAAAKAAARAAAADVAAAAADAAVAAAADVAADVAARAAAKAAARAARAAADRVLQTACQIWIEAAS